MVHYPEVSKLKDKYSPQKRIPPLNATKLSATGNSHDKKRGGFSPIRRSGSPVRRLNITQLEQGTVAEATKSTVEPNSGRLKRGRDETEPDLISLPSNLGAIEARKPNLEGPSTKRSRAVTFSPEVECRVVENTSYMEEDSIEQEQQIAALKQPNNSNGEQKTARSPQLGSNTDEMYQEMVYKLDNFVTTVNQRLDSLQANQSLILKQLATHRNDELHQKCESLQNSMNELIDAIKKPS
ncbi:uncharacterized protein CANTADRAFT_7476 [Suhomyces tanzawaensis NRRL Y-17324]|uniref:Uncharacterized protein n=1 Tax=Suhomyces tanzawaensis NRRL Y-17324 TaxID=984487 RepID=A0A1E4SEU2_9ASCO|nr:uncharacterized protein CANTADRAFT_7476 [Suhomyces tanzawaensis NRRL Y-17324]ODV78008.1 hypothetical protein CANTADRAFT_7476 [Suhomyces tanzawaensis NRRL Y-17324]